MKKAAGWFAGKVHRLAAKLPRGGEDLGMLLDTEALALGIEGKLKLWQALLAGSARPSTTRRGRPDPPGRPGP